MTDRSFPGRSSGVMINESMKKWFALLLAAGFVGVAPVQADETPLGEQMDAVGGALKSLRKLAKAEDRWSASAAKMREAQAACAKALGYVPATVKKMPEGNEKARAIAEYKRLLGLSYAKLCALEVAFIDEDEDKVGEILDQVKDLKKEGHKKFEDEE